MMPSSERGVAEIHSSGKSHHALVVVHASRFFGAAGVMYRLPLWRSMLNDGLSRLRDSNRGEHCKARGGLVDGIAKG